MRREIPIDFFLSNEEDANRRGLLDKSGISPRQIGGVKRGLKGVVTGAGQGFLKSTP